MRVKRRVSETRKGGGGGLKDDRFDDSLSESDTFQFPTPLSPLRLVTECGRWEDGCCWLVVEEEEGGGVSFFHKRTSFDLPLGFLLNRS